MDKKKKLIIEIIVCIAILIGITIIYNILINNPKNFKEGNMDIIEIENLEQFEKEVINQKGTTFVDFYATWCMPCKMMGPVIDEIAKEHSEVKFVKINIDNNEELAIKYNVMSIPTMLVIKDGTVTKTFVGVTDKEEIVAGL